MINPDFHEDERIITGDAEGPFFELEAEILTEGPENRKFDFDAAELAQQVCRAVSQKRTVLMTQASICWSQMKKKYTA